MGTTTTVCGFVQATVTYMINNEGNSKPTNNNIFLVDRLPTTKGNCHMNFFENIAGMNRLRQGTT